MRKIRILSILVGLLILTNLVLVFWLMRPKLRPPGMVAAEDRIQQVFQFDEAQMIQFRQSRDNHKQSLNTSMELLDDLSVSYYAETDSTKKAALLDQLLSTTETIYSINNQHFDDIRQICRADQQQHVQGLIRSLILSDRR
ncbi:MAG: hypothetical protein AAF741_11150 [Bacteroidota bacterium]